MTAVQPAKSRSAFRATLSSIAGIVGAAGACASAVEGGRVPDRRALKAVGIDAETWGRIGRR